MRLFILEMSEDKTDALTPNCDPTPQQKNPNNLQTVDVMKLITGHNMKRHKWTE